LAWCTAPSCRRTHTDIVVLAGWALEFTPEFGDFLRRADDRLLLAQRFAAAVDVSFIRPSRDDEFGATLPAEIPLSRFGGHC
jgi:hypothetical protein